MQCVSCRFENMPGVESCGRCGSPLRLAAVALDVRPPRATPWQKRLRRVLPWQRATAGAREVLRWGNRHVAAFTETLHLPVPPNSILLRLPVPGWPYFHIGEPLAGRVIVGLFVGLLVPALIFMGTYSGSILLGLAFTVHSATVLGLLFRYGGEALGRVQVGVLVLAGLGFGVYLPAGWAVTQIARPLTVRAAGEPLAEGDVLLLNRVAYRFSDPRPGDVVLYHAEEFRIPARVAGPFPVVIAGRERIDRILAGPGARVRWAEGRLSVDGAESPLRPLNPAAAPRRFEAEVPAGHYLIFATTLPRADIGLPDDYWGRTSLVPARQIEGRVSLRTQPFSRFGRIR